ncbi:MAG: LytR C-terminal domain-containing protein, partial [Actinomycetota bacterium]|nr:LytR C-terminal domain-containing protein [Actinomycetota bacterium]
VPAAAPVRHNGQPGEQAADETPEAARADSDVTTVGAGDQRVGGTDTDAATAGDGAQSAVSAVPAATAAGQAQGSQNAPAGGSNGTAAADEDDHELVDEDDDDDEVTEQYATARPAAALRRGNPSTTARPRNAAPASSTPAAGSFRGRKPLIILASVLALAGAGIGAAALAGDDDPQQTPTATPTATSTPDPAAARAETTVAVLNGTITTGLAAKLQQQLTTAGYQEGPRGTLPSQSQASVVYYRAGTQDQAGDVARLAAIANVQPLDETAESQLSTVKEGQSLAGAQVVVVAGQDKADEALQAP